MLALVALTITYAVILIRSVANLFSARWQTRRFSAEMSNLLRTHRSTDILTLARSNDVRSSPLAQSLNAGIETWRKHAENETRLSLAWNATREIMNQTANASIAHVGRGQIALLVVGSTALFVSILGCIFGRTNAFLGMSLTGSGGIAAVSYGLALALVTPVWGLALAIPVVWSYAWLSFRTRSLRLDVGREMCVVLGWLAQTPPSTVRLNEH
jgi:biopolymer transport protein ExbB/TolQ